MRLRSIRFSSNDAVLCVIAPRVTLWSENTGPASHVISDWRHHRRGEKLTHQITHKRQVERALDLSAGVAGMNQEGWVPLPLSSARHGHCSGQPEHEPEEQEQEVDTLP
jgi:hypothetical protein